VRQCGGQTLRQQGVAISHEGSPLDDVAQFPRVDWKLVRLKPRPRRLAQREGTPPPQVGQQRIREPADVVAPLAQGRQTNRESAQPVGERLICGSLISLKDHSAAG
jgi:hypothetical protein